MADTKISDLAAVTSLLGTDEFVLARSGDTKKVDASDMLVAASVAFTPAGTIAATDVQAAIEEVAAEAGSPSTASAMLGYVTPTSVTAIGSTNIFAVRTWLPQTADFTKFLFRIGTQSGNMDLGVYDSTGTAIRREGSFAVPASGRATRTLGGGTLTLSGGEYILAVQMDNGSASIGLVGTANQEAIAYTPTNTFPLPSTMTLTVGGTGSCLSLIP